MTQNTEISKEPGVLPVARENRLSFFIRTLVDLAESVNMQDAYALSSSAR